MENLFIQLSDDLLISIFKKKKLTLMTGFVVQGHILQINPVTLYNKVH